jgi:RNA polymerase sigma-70 factor (ECF subfamily)
MLLSKRVMAEIWSPARVSAPHSPAERELIERLTRAFEASDVEAIVALLSEDVLVAMPPLEYVGCELASRFLMAVTLQQRRRNRIVPARRR